MSEEISFDASLPKKEAPAIDTEKAETEKMRESVLGGIKKGEIKKEEETKAGIKPAEGTTTIGESVGWFMFHIGAKGLDCPQFELNEKESKFFCENINMLIPPQSSKILAILNIVLLVVFKCVQCWRKVKTLFKKEKTEEKTTEIKTPAITETL